MLLLNADIPWANIGLALLILAGLAALAIIAGLKAAQITAELEDEERDCE